MLCGSKATGEEVRDDQGNRPGRARGRRPGSGARLLDGDAGLRARPGRTLRRRAVARGADAGRSGEDGAEPAAGRAADRSGRAADVEHHVLLRRPAPDVRRAERSRRRVPAAAGRAAVRMVVAVPGHRGQPLRPHAPRGLVTCGGNRGCASAPRRSLAQPAGATAEPVAASDLADRWARSRFLVTATFTLRWTARA